MINNKFKIMRYTIITILFLFLSCKSKDDEIGRPDSYILTEKHISKDCSAFQMNFKEGKYILNFALSGTCKELKVENYTKEYSSYLTHYKDSLFVKKGYILLQYYGLNTSIKDFQDSIIHITKKKFKTDDVSLVEEDDFFFRIQVGNDKDISD